MFQRACRASRSWSRFTSALALAATALVGCSASIGDGDARDAAIGSSADASAGGPDAAVGAEPDASGTPDAAGVQPDARLPCIEGDDRVEDAVTGACYMYFASALTWDDAQAACAELGGHLAAITSLRENELASRALPSEPPLQDVWIGASDQDSGERNFTWVSGEPFDFTHWRRGEPNDGGDNGEDCALMEGDNNVPGEGCLWDDRPCDNPRAYLCERL